MRILKAPLNDQQVRDLHAGEEVLIDGVIYALRDAGHKRLVDTLKNNRTLPLNIEGQIIYYTGPCPAPPGRVIGSAGPTTSSRMDDYTPQLLAQGLRAMIGKGDRSREVIEAMQTYGAVYLAAVGGAGAYLARHITAVETIAYPELGPEALLRLKVQSFPCFVAIDAFGYNIYWQVMDKFDSKDHKEEKDE